MYYFNIVCVFLEFYNSIVPLIEFRIAWRLPQALEIERDSTGLQFFLFKLR